MIEIVNFSYSPITSAIFQNGEVTTEEFMEAIRRTCIGKPFSELPNSFKGFIDSIFKTIDIDGTSLFMIPSLLIYSGNESPSHLSVINYYIIINSGTLLKILLRVEHLASNDISPTAR